jgi:DNA-binding protein HU-beta
LRRDKVNKAELVQELTSRFDGNKRQAQEALDHVLEAITRSVAKGERVVITGFGAFERVDRPARSARNPRTGERVKVKKTSVPRFKAGAEFKSYVSGAKKLPKAAAAPAKTAKTASANSRSAAKTSTAGSTKKAATKTATNKSTATKSAATKKSTGTRSASTGTKKATTKRSTTKRAATKS